jgi:hypothetical protein
MLLPYMDHKTLLDKRRRQSVFIMLTIWHSLDKMWSIINVRHSIHIRENIMRGSVSKGFFRNCGYKKHGKVFNRKDCTRLEESNPTKLVMYAQDESFKEQKKIRTE